MLSHDTVYKMMRRTETRITSRCVDVYNLDNILADVAAPRVDEIDHDGSKRERSTLGLPTTR